MQPYFLPALSYFHLVAAADIFVFYDDVQFVRKRWTHRNFVKVADRPTLFSIPLDKPRQSAKINEVTLHTSQFPRWRDRFLRTLQHSYSAAPFGKAMIAKISQLLHASDGNLANLAEHSVRWAANHIGLHPDWRRSSQIDGPSEARGQARLIKIAKEVGARSYANTAGGRALYSAADFAAEDIVLGFTEPQPGLPQDAALSILHLMMHYPAAELKTMAMQFTIAGSAVDR